MVEKETVRRGYDGVADEFAAQRSFDEQEQVIIERFLDSLPPDPLILDAGCGNGVPVLRTLTEMQSGSPPVGLDISATQLDLAVEQTAGPMLVQGDFTRLLFADSIFDGVVAFYSLIHVPADQHQHAIDEFARVVRPGGRVLISEGADHWEGRNPDWLETEVEMQWHIAGAPTTRRQMRNAGFTIQNEWTVADVLVEGESWVFFEAVLQE